MVKRRTVFLILLAIAPSAFAEHWIGTWAASAEHWSTGRLTSYNNQTLRLIVHTSAGGAKARIHLSNTYGDQPLRVDAVHIARRASGADIDAASDRVVTFGGQRSVTITPHASAVSDAVDIDVAPLSDLAISLFFRDTALVTTIHALAQQTSYVSGETGDATGDAKFTVAKTIASWPFLTGVDVDAPTQAFSIVAFDSSLTDGDGSSKDANKRWPDVLAARLRNCGAIGVLNEGIIGNRLLADSSSPRQKGGPFGAVYEDLSAVIGESGLKRFDRDVLDQPGARYVILALGINDILFPGAFTPAANAVSAHDLVEGNRALSRRAHDKGMRAIVTTLPPCEGAFFRGPTISFCTPGNEKVRTEFNAWARTTKEFDGMIDFDAAVRDPSRPTRILPEFDSGDHLHPNDAGYVASGNIVPLALFGCSQ